MDIVISNVSKQYGDNKVLDHVSFTFQDGSTTCIMGESGVGKTTLLGIIMGKHYDQGEVQTSKKLSVVFQEDRLCDNLSPISNVLMVCNGMLNHCDKIKEELMMVLPEECLYKKVSELSGGMRQRVAIVRAMIADSDTILMDEPFKGLDDSTKAMVITYIKLRQNTRTLIVSTHNQQDCKHLGGEICVLTKA